MKKNTSTKSFILVSFLVVAALLCFVGKDNIFTWIGAAHTIAEQKREIRELERMNRDLDRRIDAMSNDRDTLETYAREVFHFTRQGDDVFLFDE